MLISLETWPSPSPWSKTGCAAGLQREAAAATSARGRRTPFSALTTSPPDKVRHSSKDRREIGALRPNIDALCPRADTPVGYFGGIFRADTPGGYSRGRYSTSAYASTVSEARTPCRHGSASRGAPPRLHPWARTSSHPDSCIHLRLRRVHNAESRCYS